jgi:hypothetical protein
VARLLLSCIGHWVLGVGSSFKNNGTSPEVCNSVLTFSKKKIEDSPLVLVINLIYDRLTVPLDFLGSKKKDYQNQVYDIIRRGL